MNSNELINVTLNFPIFNNGHLHNAVQQSKVQLQNAQLQKEQDNIQLKQNIYTAFSNALYGHQKLAESQIMVDESQKVYDYTYKGYQLGSIDAFTLITAQNNLLKSKLQQLTNQYDYTLKTEILKFYFTAP